MAAEWQLANFLTTKMGKGANANGNVDLKSYGWEEIGKHTHRDDKWIVIDGLIYDITSFQKRHPGGARIIGHYAAQDATVCF